MDMFGGSQVWLPAFFAVCAFFLLVIGVGVIFNLKWAKREFEALRKAHRDAGVTDPQNTTARALTTASATDHDRHAAADRLTRSPESGDDGGGSDGGGGD